VLDPVVNEVAPVADVSPTGIIAVVSPVDVGVPEVFETVFEDPVGPPEALVPLLEPPPTVGLAGFELDPDC